MQERRERRLFRQSRAAALVARLLRETGSGEKGDRRKCFRVRNSNTNDSAPLQRGHRRSYTRRFNSKVIEPPFLSALSTAMRDCCVLRWRAKHTGT